MQNDNDRAPTDNDIVATFSEIARAIKSVRILAASVVAVVSVAVGLPYVHQPTERTVEQLAAQRPEIFRPDAWKKSDDREAMAALRKEIEREHIRIWHEVESCKDRLYSGRSREHYRINALEARLKRLEENSR